MIPVYNELKKKGKTALEFINYLFDDRRKLNIPFCNNKNLISIKRNGVDGKLYIEPEIKDIFDEFINT